MQELRSKCDAGPGYRRLPAHDMTYYRDAPGVSVIGFSFRVPGDGAETLRRAFLAGHDPVTSVEPNRWAPDRPTPALSSESISNTGQSRPEGYRVRS